MKFITKFLFILIFVFFMSPIGYSMENKEYTGIVRSTEKDSYRVVIKNDQNNSNEIYAISGDDQSIYKRGDRVQVLQLFQETGESSYLITDHVRVDSIILLFILFAFVVVLISKKPGFSSLIGMLYSFFIIFNFLLPKLYSGTSPILITLFSVILIAPITFVLSHGINNKTFVALISTFISLITTIILALLFINNAHITGFGSEEAYFLQMSSADINIQGIFLAGIIIGTMGILDDATITQASIVAKLKSTKKSWEPIQLFRSAMDVGHDHIASTVNTLILVYTGAALPLLLLYVRSNKTFFSILNNPIVAEEFVTMLVSSIGLILSIPITTLLATIFVDKDDGLHDHHGHSH